MLTNGKILKGNHSPNGMAVGDSLNEVHGDCFPGSHAAYANLGSWAGSDCSGSHILEQDQ